MAGGPPVAVSLRAAHERDAERAGDVGFVASYRSALTHGVSPAVNAPGGSRGYIRQLLALDPLGGVVAEEDGEIVGVGWVHRRGPVATIGPLAVDPRAQGRGIGRRLLERCLEVAGPGVPQVRLVQDGHDAGALGLCLRTGFRVVAPLLALERPAAAPVAAPDVGAGLVIRAAGAEDRARLVARDARAFGAERPQSVDVYLRDGRALVAVRSGGLAGYALGIGFDGTAHLGAASADDADLLLALLATLAADLSRTDAPVRILVPAADRRLVDGLVHLGFRVFRSCLYLVRGGGTPPPPNYVLMGADLL
jgi:hypothetical protein